MPSKNGAAKAPAKPAVPEALQPPETLKLLGLKDDSNWMVVVSLAKTPEINADALLQIVQQSLDAGQKSMRLGSSLVPLGQFYGYRVA